MNLQKLVVFAFLLIHFYGKPQSGDAFLVSDFLKNPDTLYFPFNEDDLQLIIINSYDPWIQQGSLYDAMYPRGGSWFLNNGPAPKNCYLWRNRNGKIAKAYNTAVDGSQIDGIQIGLRSTDYTNRTDFSSIGFDISDYSEFNRCFKFYSGNNKVGLIDIKGNVVVPADFDDIRKLWNRPGSSNILLVEKDGRIGLLNADLKELFPPVFTEYPQEIGGYIKVAKNKKYGLIHENGAILIDLVFDDIKPIHDSLYMGMVCKDSSELKKLRLNTHWNWGYKVKDCTVFDKDFRVIAELKDYEYIYYWGIKRFIVKKNNQFGVLNHKGEVVIPLEYDELFSANGYYTVRKGGKYGLLDMQGKLVLPAEFERVEFYGQAIYVTQNGLIGIYNDQFRLIAKPQFKDKTWERGNYILTRPDGSKGFVSHQNMKASYYESPEGKRIQL
jgi:hypothetical protein